MRRSIGRAALGALFVVALTAGLAQAHASLVRSAPAADERLSQAPSQIALFFDEELETQGSRFEIVDGQGRVVAGAEGRVDLTDPEHARLLAEQVPALPDDVYLVRWTALSADGDGVPTEGAFYFYVGAAAPRPSPTPAPALVAAAPVSVSAPAPAPDADTPAGLWVVGGAAMVLMLMGFGLLRRR